jgi:hypothetical protein
MLLGHEEFFLCQEYLHQYTCWLDGGICRKSCHFGENALSGLSHPPVIIQQNPNNHNP